MRFSERVRIPAEGIGGCGDGATGALEINGLSVDPKVQHVLRPGDVVTLRPPGGGAAAAAPPLPATRRPQPATAASATPDRGLDSRSERGSERPQSGKNVRGFLRFPERWKLGLYCLPFELAAGTNQHPLDVGPVLGPLVECLEYDEILRRARGEGGVRKEMMVARAIDHPFLERERAERDVDRDPAFGPEEKHAAAVRELGGIRSPLRKRAAELLDVVGFAAEPGQDGEIHVCGKARLAPALERDAANEAEPPSATH